MIAGAEQCLVTLLSSCSWLQMLVAAASITSSPQHHREEENKRGHSSDNTLILRGRRSLKTPVDFSLYPIGQKWGTCPLQDQLLARNDGVNMSGLEKSWLGL